MVLTDFEKELLDEFIETDVPCMLQSSYLDLDDSMRYIHLRLTHDNSLSDEIKQVPHSLELSPYDESGLDNVHHITEMADDVLEDILKYVEGIESDNTPSDADIKEDLYIEVDEFLTYSGRSRPSSIVG